MVQQPLHNALMYGKLELAQHIVRKYAADMNSVAQVCICVCVCACMRAVYRSGARLVQHVWCGLINLGNQSTYIIYITL